MRRVAAAWYWSWSASPLPRPGRVVSVLRRARLQVEQGHPWEALERADAAGVTARRAMTNGADATPAVQALVSAAIDLAESHGVTLPGGAALAPSSAHVPAVTETVTESSSANRRRKPVDAVPDRAATVAVASERVELPPAIEPREVVDTDKVRMERIPSRRDDNRSKVVLAGHGDGTRLVGFLEPQGIQSGTPSRSAGHGWMVVPSGPARTHSCAGTYQ